MTQAITEGRREAHKRETRAALHEASMRLMTRDGFHATTVADIAAAAGVSPRTFFGYFPSKEAALFAPLDDLITTLETRLTPTSGTRPDALDTFRSWITDDLAGSGTLIPYCTTLFQELAMGAEVIADHGLRFADRVTQALAQALRAQLDADAADPLPDAAAAAVVSAATDDLPVRARTSVAVEMNLDLNRMIRDTDRAIAFVRAGLAATRT